ncbi:52 kDa repressor of the inhibitor of the protein kinase [Ooceraea biroi]|uniref:52 kDa repressor of the inhibitor of the protein kinase n=1 Tax=Ooceraea biroi TaxID=2015173 RepID=A0A026WX94_OOCBI|nr:52 kDa repressor of the inhibitor of the protein kinase [Ooceraea biroi]
MKKSSGYKVCSVKHCKNTSANSNCHFFRFPKDSERTKQWLIACNRENLMLNVRKTAEKIYANNRICSNHFKGWMYTNHLKTRLLPSAQPTVNLSETDENDQNIVVSK